MDIWFAVTFRNMTGHVSFIDLIKHTIRIRITFMRYKSCVTWKKIRTE